MISLPKSWSTYYHDIVTRSHSLIDYNIWDGLDKNRLNVWLRNFTNNEEKYLSACILDSLIYRSKPQTLSLIYELIYRVIGNNFHFNVPFGKDGNDFPSFMQQSNTDPRIRFVAVRRQADSPTKSSFEILRYMRVHYSIADKWIIEPSQIGNAVELGVEIFVFIDDFLGTGNQFCTMCDEQKLLPYMSQSYFLYAPLVAHQSGIGKIEKTYSQVHVCYTEWLSAEISFFNAYFNDKDNTPNRAKAFYESIIENRELILDSERYYGYGALELSYGFEHGAPDNSLPLLWVKSDNWNPLLNR